MSWSVNQDKRRRLANETSPDYFAGGACWAGKIHFFSLASVASLASGETMPFFLFSPSGPRSDWSVPDAHAGKEENGSVGEL